MGEEDARPAYILLTPSMTADLGDSTMAPPTGTKKFLSEDVHLSTTNILTEELDWLDPKRRKKIEKMCKVEKTLYFDNDYHY